MSPVSRRRYTDEQKQQAIILAESIGPSAAARQLNISVKSLANWLSAARAGQPLRSPARQAPTELESELSRLKAENATLRMEREILKKRRRSSPKSPSEVRLRRS
jgi:transposase-like protein